ncbi:hypothetical protein PR048_013071 [Dryococelus australis]|uniref:Uncharacterized protein n=1 Tax=Dryococelus australis TaxID=614101 RepID=A0ABQ9HR57_9NEOP|nr:hypothetical protein PR048_013071 [Dryococelus australis]
MRRNGTNIVKVPCPEMPHIRTRRYKRAVFVGNPVASDKSFNTVTNTPAIFNDVLRNMLRRCRACIECEGDNFEQLLPNVLQPVTGPLDMLEPGPYSTGAVCRSTGHYLLECEKNGNSGKQSPPVTTPQMTEGQCSSNPPDMSSNDKDIRLVLEVSSDEFMHVDDSDSNGGCSLVDIPRQSSMTGCHASRGRKKVLVVSSRKRQPSRWKRNIKKQLKAHESSYKELRKDKLHSKGNCNCITMSFELQKCLPTPLLTSGAAYYKRQLWKLHLTIYKTGHKKSAAFSVLWHEAVAA